MNAERPRVCHRGAFEAFVKPLERGVVNRSEANDLVLVGVELDTEGSDLFNK